MATWKDLSRDCYEAATLLVSESYLRSGVSRAYYAAYCAVSNLMTAQGVSLPHAWKNPAHDQVIRWLASQKSWGKGRRRTLVRALRSLRRGREDADYWPGVSLAKGDAVKLLKDAVLVLHALKIDNEANSKKQSPEINL